MPYELANLIVTVEAERSALVAALAATRAELADMEATGGAKVNLTPDSDEAKQSVAKLRRAMDALKIPESLSQQVEMIGADAKRAAEGFEDVPPPIAKGTAEATLLAEAMERVAAGTAGAADKNRVLRAELADAKKKAIAIEEEKAKATKAAEDKAKAWQKHLDGATDASQGLLNNITSIGGINLQNVIGLASLAGIGGAMKGLLDTFMKTSDEAKILPIQLAQAGNQAGLSMEKINKFRREMVMAGQTTMDDITKAIQVAATKGPEKFRGEVLNTVKAAQALAAANGQSVEQNVKLINLGQQNYSNMQRMLKQLGLQVRPHATMAEYQDTLNKAIARGNELLEARKDTFAVQMRKITNTIDLFRRDMAMALGPSFIAPLKMMGVTVELVTGSIKQFVGENKNAVGIFGKVVVGVMLAVGALAALKAGVFAVGILGGQVRGLISPLLTVISTLAGYAYAAGAALWGGVVAPMATIRALAPMVGKAIKAALISTGVGAIIALVGGILQATGAIDWLIDGAKKLFAAFAKGGAGMSWLGKMWEKIKIEALIAWNAITSAFWGYVELVKKGVNLVIGILGKMFGGPKTDLAGTWQWIKDAASSVWNWVVNLWTEFLAEISVFGERMEQYYLLFAVLIDNAGAIIRWIGEVISEVATFAWELVRDNFSDLLVLATTQWRLLSAFTTDVIKWLIEVVGDYAKEFFVYVGSLVKKFTDWAIGTIKAMWDWLKANWTEIPMRLFAIAQEWVMKFFDWAVKHVKDFWAWIKDPKKWKDGLTFGTTREELEKTKKAAEAIAEKAKKIKMPTLNLTGSAADQLAKMQAQIDAKKDKFKSDAEKMRKDLKDVKDAKDKAKDDGGPGKNPQLGKQVTGGFSDLLGQWKKVQEAAVDGQFSTLEQEAKKQTAQQREGNQKLDNIDQKLGDMANRAQGAAPPLIPQ